MRPPSRLASLHSTPCSPLVFHSLSADTPDPSQVLKLWKSAGSGEGGEITPEELRKVGRRGEPPTVCHLSAGQQLRTLCLGHRPRINRFSLRWQPCCKVSALAFLEGKASKA